jgi:TonB family protein
LAFLQLEYRKSGADLKSSYALNLKKSLIVALVFQILFIYLFPSLDSSPRQFDGPNIVIDVENIPITRQTRQPSPPPKPSVPIPTDDEAIPEDETIEETTLKYTTVFDYTPENAPGFSGNNITPPRPLAWVFPEYPESDRKKGVKGVVKLSIHISEQGRVVEVVVLDNTTGSEKCAEAAIAAARGSRFLPAREGTRAIDYWITQPYRFELRN